MKRSLILAAAICALPMMAHAQLQVQPVPLNVTPVDCSASVGTTAGQVLAANGNRRGFLLMNVSSANIGISFTSASPSIGGAQTFTLAPGASLNSNATGTPGTAIYAIASAAGSELSCEWN